MAKLGDLCEVLNGYAFKSSEYVSCGIRIIRISNVQKGYIEDLAPVFYPENNRYALQYLLNKDDILMSLTGNVGRVAMLTNNYMPATLNQRVACIRIKEPEQILKSYLFHYLNSDFFENKCISSSKGVAQKNMSTEWLKNQEINLPSVPIQKKISLHFKTIDNLILSKKQQLSKLDELVKSQFIEMFGDCSDNPKGWKIKKFNDFARIDATMTTDYDFYADYPHIGIDSIEKDTGKLIGYRTVKEDHVISGKYIFTPEHIIYSKIRPNLNKVALPDFDGVCSADAYPILPNKENCNRIYLAVLLRSKFFLNYILGFSARWNMPKVNRKQVEGFAAPLPPKSLQNEFALFYEQADKSKFEIQGSIDKLETLKKSLMQKYFG